MYECDPGESLIYMYQLDIGDFFLYMCEFDIGGSIRDDMSEFEL